MPGAAALVGVGAILGARFPAADAVLVAVGAPTEALVRVGHARRPPRFCRICRTPETGVAWHAQLHFRYSGSSVPSLSTPLG